MRELNAEIDRLAAPPGAVVLEPDFEAIVGLRGHSHKPERAWRAFRGLSRTEMPALARGQRPA